MKKLYKICFIILLLISNSIILIGCITSPKKMYKSFLNYADNLEEENAKKVCSEIIEKYSDTEYDYACKSQLEKDELIALKHINKAIAINENEPNFIALRILLNDILKNNPEQMERDFEILQNHKMEYSFINCFIGITDLELKDAIFYCDKYIEYRNKKAAPYLYKGAALINRLEFEDGLRNLLKAWTINSSFNYIEFINVQKLFRLQIEGDCMDLLARHHDLILMHQCVDD